MPSPNDIARPAMCALRDWIWNNRITHEIPCSYLGEFYNNHPEYMAVFFEYSFDELTRMFPNDIAAVGYRGCIAKALRRGKNDCYLWDGLSEVPHDVKSVIIMPSVTSIGEYAFQYRTSLESVTIPDSVTTIGEGAFYGCESLTVVTIPDSVTMIGEGAFESCKSLVIATISKGIEKLDSCIFGKCTSLAVVTIPYGVKSIEDGAFWNCTSLTSLHIPESVVDMHERALKGCPAFCY